LYFPASKWGTTGVKTANTEITTKIINGIDCFKLIFSMITTKSRC
jgi:hypothetical protein